MNLPRIKKRPQDIRDVLSDDRAIKKAAKASIKKQKKKFPVLVSDGFV